MVGQRRTETVFVKGKFKWVKHIRPDPMYNKWSMVLYPDAESLDKIKLLKKEGVQNHLKMDDDGWFIQFSRPQSRTFGGKEEGMIPPRVIDKMGVPILVPIGNGSDGIVELEVYQHKTQKEGERKKAARWAGLRVDNLVEFKPQTDYSEEELLAIKKLSEEPEQLF